MITSQNVSIQKINKVLNWNESETGGQAGILETKVNARVMLTVNIDLQDRLVNGRLGKIMHIARNSQDISKINLGIQELEQKQ